MSTQEITSDKKEILDSMKAEFRTIIQNERFPDQEPTAQELKAISDEVSEHVERVYANLEDAKAGNAHLHMEGDWGGQIYLSVPAAQVFCDEQRLKQLLAEIDEKEWSCNNGDGTSLTYRKGIKEIGINGGMGGGEITDSLWVHPEMDAMKPVIQDVLDGKRPSIKENK